ncbi:MarR family transcriptional regulator [Cohnella lubricantis]|uniref:MarR family transcriptional regulator n=1 Tax=Cohnella lubricantis TaxID=2163172 RepID=A0A841TCK3_9BACL|nr:MarR family transcriptional regulator [Cohnella lubricantis]MBB6676707.1 MarR family transcriptional regulator [Cohnella lubricantis]MBP2117753.1 DNA-binding MarR family transcriptional regulator [Cohnella lubricantis]
MADYEELVELFGLVRLHGHLWRTEWSKDNPQDISISQLQTLDLLVNEGPKASSYLAQIIGVTSGGMTVISDKLVRLGLVQRVNDENDRRVVKLEITEKGREALRDIQAKRVALMEKMYHVLNPEEFQQLLHIYRKLISAYEQ